MTIAFLFSLVAVAAEAQPLAVRQGHGCITSIANRATGESYVLFGVDCLLPGICLP